MGPMTMSEAKEIQRLREENACHKRPLGQAELEKASWKELSEGNFYAPLAIMMPCGIWSSGATPKDILARSLGSLVVPIGVPERAGSTRLSGCPSSRPSIKAVIRASVVIVQALQE